MDCYWVNGIKNNGFWGDIFFDNVNQGMKLAPIVVRAFLVIFRFRHQILARGAAVVAMLTSPSGSRGIDRKLLK